MAREPLNYLRRHTLLNDYAVWDAFNNHSWPALYIVDAQGRIRHHQFGESDYEEAELTIQQLLTEAGIGSVAQDLVTAVTLTSKVTARCASRGCTN